MLAGSRCEDSDSPPARQMTAIAYLCRRSTCQAELAVILHCGEWDAEETTLNEEALRQFSFLSSLLAGFSVMVTVSLLSLKDKRRIVSWVIGVMVLAAGLFLTSTSIAVMYFIVPSDMLGQVPPELLSQMPPDMPVPDDVRVDFIDAVAASLAVCTYVGTLAFSFGLALMGWIRSTLVGLISTISALLFVLVFNLIVVVAGILVLFAGV